MNDASCPPIWRIGSPFARHGRRVGATLVRVGGTSRLVRAPRLTGSHDARMSTDPPRPFAHRLQARPSLTAEAVTMARALEHLKPPEQRVIDDPWAQLFLSAASRRALAAWSGSFTGRVLRRLGATGTTYVPLRHRFIDDHLTTALDAGAAQVVLLGAGYDTRAYRFAGQLNGRPVFEVDLAPISRAKAAVVAKHQADLPTANVVRVEIDFETQALTDVLPDAGFTPGADTFVVWEGVPMYLT